MFNRTFSLTLVGQYWLIYFHYLVYSYKLSYQLYFPQQYRKLSGSFSSSFGVDVVGLLFCCGRTLAHWVVVQVIAWGIIICFQTYYSL